MAALPQTQRAMVYGTGKHHMSMREGVPVPAPTAKQLLVRVHAASVNPVDYKLPTLPLMGWILKGKGVGLDFSGVVERVGASVAGFAPGDRVFGKAGGTIAEFTVADASAVAKVPAGVTHAEAAALPVISLTGLQALEDHGFRPGDRVLVAGASGGTGSVGVQLAKCLGASFVAGICSGANAPLVKSLGADEVADYTKGDKVLEEQLAAWAPFDMCYDCVTSPEDKNYEGVSRKVLKRGGMHVQINGSAADFTRSILSKLLRINLQRRNFAIFLARNDGPGLARIVDWVASKKMKVIIDSQVPFTEAGVHSAFDKLKSRRTKGKIVVGVLPDAA